jgi:hypothetical protein
MLGRRARIVVAVVSVRHAPTPIVPVTPVLESAAELASTHTAQVGSTHRTAEMTSAHPTQVGSTHRTAQVASPHPAADVASATAVTSSASAAATCERIGRDASTSHCYGGNDDRDSFKRKFPHGSFLSG